MTAAASIELSRADGVVHLPGGWPWTHGGELVDGHVAFRSFGNPGAPLVVVLGGISADRRVADAADGRGWWRGVVAAERGAGVDLGRYRVVGIDWLGGAGASSAVAPGVAVDPRDQARAVLAVVERIAPPGTRAHVVGSSYGGMVGLHAARLAPERIASVLAISAADRSEPLATAWRSLQRRIVQLGVDGADSERGLALARGLAMTTYRTADEFAERFDAAPGWRNGRPEFAVEPYLAARGADFATRFTPDAFVTLSESLDLHRIEPAAIPADVPLTFVGVPSDVLVPAVRQRELVDRLGERARYVELRSRFGHDAFLKDVANVRRLVRAALNLHAAREEVRR